MAALLEAGLSITFIGMTVVFVLLTLLVGIIRGMSILAARIEGSQPATPAAAPAASDETEITGIIAAAIAAYRGRRR